MDPAASDRSGTEPLRDRTVACALAAMSSLLQYGVAPSPPHFTVWFEYHAGSHALLRRVIDTYLSNGKPITEALLLELHARFVDPLRERDALMDTSRQLQDATELVKGLVSEAGGQSDAYGRTLGAFGQELRRDDADLALALQRMTRATEDMARRSAEMSLRLEDSTRAVADLQARLQEAMHEARTDALTGLPNRRAIEVAAVRLANQAESTGTAFAIAMLDIDRFKVLNDTWGHPVGDAVLRRVALTLQEGLQPGALCGRFGGEEFIVLLPECSLTEAVTVTERLRQSVAEQVFSVKATGRTLGDVTVSGGVAVRHAREAWGRLAARADAALYRAKQAGRNRVLWDEAA